MGEYSHTIDTKGRLIVPSKFRESLGDSFVVTKGLDGCLFVYDMTEWKSFEEKLKELLAGASQVEVDKQGRILIPNVLREFAGLEKDVVFLGVGSRIEIWSRQAWDGEGNFDDMDDIAERMADLGLSI